MTSQDIIVTITEGVIVLGANTTIHRLRGRTGGVIHS